jgi:hypothetical protein
MSKCYRGACGRPRREAWARRVLRPAVLVLFWLVMGAALTASAAATAGFLFASYWNYPGGAAVARLPALLGTHRIGAAPALSSRPSPRVQSFSLSVSGRLSVFSSRRLAPRLLRVARQGLGQCVCTWTCPRA